MATMSQADRKLTLKAKKVRRTILLKVSLYTPDGEGYEWQTEEVSYEGAFLRFKDIKGNDILISGSIIVESNQKNNDEEEDDE